MSEKGAKVQEYFEYFKLLQRIYDAKFPQGAADAFNQGFLNAAAGKICRKDVRLALCEQALRTQALRSNTNECGFDI